MTAHSRFGGLSLALLVTCAGCSSSSPAADGPLDGSADSAATANDAANPQPIADANAADAASLDATPDARPDAGLDASLDAPADAHLDAARGASDAAPDASDAAPAADGSADAGDDVSASPYRGAIFATSDSTTAPDGGAQLDYSAGGYFVHQTSPDESVVATTVGPCLVQVYGNGSGPVETNESAGSVQITGGHAPITLTPGAGKDYTTVEGSDANLWSGGETITVTASGGDVPAFTASFVAPSKITLTSPALPSASGALSVPRDAPWNATWTGTSSGVVVLYFDESVGSNAYAVTCSFDASLGTAQVPTAAFANFTSGSGTFDFYVQATSAPVIAGWDIHVNATSLIVDGTGAGAAGSTSYP